MEAVRAATGNDVTAGANLDAIGKRNLAIAYTEAVVMAHYQAVRGKLMTGRAVSSIAFDVLDLGLTAAVPIVNFSRGKTILGALATGLKGTNLSIDQNLFNQQTTSAILSAMDACVTRQRKTLEVNRTRPANEYFLYDAYGDLTQLYGCTTLAGAVQELVETQSVATREQRGTIAPVTIADREAAGAIQTAFLQSIEGDKADAVKFLSALKVSGISNQSTKDEFLNAYRGLAFKVLTDTAFRQTFLAAARTAGLLAAQ